MNTKYINSAFDIISQRRASAIDGYNSRRVEVESKVPEIAGLNAYLANTSHSIILASLKKNVDVEKEVEKIKKNNLYTQSRIAKLLVENGYDKDYLNIKYTCEKCSDTGYYHDDYCDCLKLLIKQLATKEINKNSKLKLCSFETFDLNRYSTEFLPRYHATVRQIMTDYYEKLLNYANTFDMDKPNILMYGKTGVGKTHLSLAIAKRVMELGYNVVYNACNEMVSTIEREKFSKDRDFSEDSLEVYINADLLIIDDLGAEFNTQFSKSVIYNIINSRYIHGMPTIISTNYEAKDISTKYDQRIASRLFSYKGIQFLGEDIRVSGAHASENKRDEFMDL